MKIGIAGLCDKASNYIEALHSCDPGLQAEVSLCPKKAHSWDALILPGGGDIDAALLPGRPPLDHSCQDVDPVLDRQQLAMLSLFVREKKPVLGICKGMQLINLYFGGGFCQDLPGADTHRYLEYDQFHAAHAKKGSFLAALYGCDHLINSAHHQGITNPGRGLAILQRAADGVAEGICHEELPIIGLQWHPERLCQKQRPPQAVDGQLLFAYFLSSVRSHSSC